MKMEKMRRANGIQTKIAETEEEPGEVDADSLILGNSNQQKSQQDTSRTLVALLKACAKQKDLDRGAKIHAVISKLGLLKDNIFLGNTLVSMYAQCGALAIAHEVYHDLSVRDVVSWNALIAGCVQHGSGEQALKYFGQMQLEGIFPNAVTFICALKACGSIGAADRGQDIHAQIIGHGLLEQDVKVGTALIDMYAKCGQLAKAQDVLDKLPGRNVVSWSALITGYVQGGYHEQALKCFDSMQLEGHFPNAVTVASVLKACGNIGAVKKGQDIHDVLPKEAVENDIVIGTALVDMYAKCGLLTKAQELFDKLEVQNLVSWNVLIAGYTQHGHAAEALDCFERMQLEGYFPDSVTFVCILKACGSMGAADKGKQIHAEVVKEGLLEKNIVVGNTLVDMYVKFGMLDKAQEVFDKLPVRDTISWSSLIAGYAEHGLSVQALNCFEQMRSMGFLPNAVTFICILKACGDIGAADKGQEIHYDITRLGLLEKDITIGTALVDMYAKFGLLTNAQEVFDRLLIRDVVSWSALIAGYAEHGHGEKALTCYEQMLIEGLSPNAVTFLSGLKACGSIGAVDKGQELHIEIVKAGLLKTDIVVGNTLVDMYAKCGLLAEAQEVFDNLPFHNVVSWNVIMAGYALLGKAEKIFTTFDKMKGEGIQPDSVTFTILLNACSHTGSLVKGQMYFDIMSTDYSITATSEHHTCMVDLFARAGHLDRAIEVIMRMPSFVDLKAWHIVLAACQKWENLKLGRLAFEHAVQLDEKDAVAYVCMSNIYANAGKQADADKVEALRVKNQAWEKLGHRQGDKSAIVHSIRSKRSRGEHLAPALPFSANKDIVRNEKSFCTYSLKRSKETPFAAVGNDCHSAASLVLILEKHRNSASHVIFSRGHLPVGKSFHGIAAPINHHLCHL